MVLDGRFSQECLINAKVSQGSILGFGLFLLHIYEFSGDAIYSNAIYADGITIY